MVPRRKNPLFEDPALRQAYSEEDLIRRVAERIHFYRDLRDLTQTELATRLEAKQPWIARIEKGHENITLRTLAGVALALGCRPEDLVQREVSRVH